MRAVSGLDPLVVQWLDRFPSANTRAAYRRDMDAFATWCAAQGKSVLRVTGRDVLRYRAHCVAGGARPATVARRLSAVASFYRHAVAAGVVAHNPVDGIDRADTTPRRRAPVLDDQQRHALLEAAGTLGPKVEVLVSLLLLDGLKIGEALALQVGDVAWTARGTTAAVSRRHARQEVPLDRRTSSAIAGYLGDRNAGPLLLGSSPTGSGDAGLTRFGADFLLKQAAGRAGLEPAVSANLLRSSYIATRHQEGAEIEDIQQHVGHLHARDTRRYV